MSKYSKVTLVVEYECEYADHITDSMIDYRDILSSPDDIKIIKKLKIKHLTTN